MNIIVTGGAGFIGGNFVYHILNKYPAYRIICIDCLTYVGNMSTLKETIENFVRQTLHTEKKSIGFLKTRSRT